MWRGLSRILCLKKSAFCDNCEDSVFICDLKQLVNLFRLNLLELIARIPQFWGTFGGQSYAFIELTCNVVVAYLRLHAVYTSETSGAKLPRGLRVIFSAKFDHDLLIYKTTVFYSQQEYTRCLKKSGITSWTYSNASNIESNDFVLREQERGVI